MKRPNITEGPWNLVVKGPSLNQHGEPYRIIQTSDAALDIGAPECMAEEHEANCKAIASVPNLLAALERCLPEWCNEDDGTASDGAVACELSYGDLRAIKTALTKAGYTFP